MNALRLVGSIGCAGMLSVRGPATLAQKLTATLNLKDVTTLTYKDVCDPDKGKGLGYYTSWGW